MCGRGVEMWGAVGTLACTCLRPGDDDRPQNRCPLPQDSYFIIPLRSGVVRDIRNFVYDKITALPIGFFTVERKGDVMARMSGDVAEIENSIMSSLDMLFKNPVMIIACLGMMIAVSWQLTVFVFLLLPFVGIVMGRLASASNVSRSKDRRSGAYSWPTSRRRSAVCASSRPSTPRRRCAAASMKKNQEFYRLSNTVARRQALAHPMSEFLGTIAVP